MWNAWSRTVEAATTGGDRIKTAPATPQHNCQGANPVSVPPALPAIALALPKDVTGYVFEAKCASGIRALARVD